VDLGDAIVDDLDAVVQVGELILLAADVAGENIFEHLRDVGVVAWLLFLVGLLLMNFLRGEVGLLLVPCWAVVAGAIGLFARVGVRGRDDEFVDFKRVGVFGGGSADAEVVAFGEVYLYECEYVLYRKSNRVGAYLVSFEA
jgi:hypothetical protein